MVKPRCRKRRIILHVLSGSVCSASCFFLICLKLNIFGAWCGTVHFGMHLSKIKMVLRRSCLLVQSFPFSYNRYIIVLYICIWDSVSTECTEAISAMSETAAKTRVLLLGTETAEYPAALRPGTLSLCYNLYTY